MIKNKEEIGITIIQNNVQASTECCDLFNSSSIMPQWVIQTPLLINDALGMIRADINQKGGLLTVIGANSKTDLNKLHYRLLRIQASGLRFQNVLIYQPCKDERIKWVLPIVELNTDSSIFNLNNTEHLSMHRIIFNPLFSTFVVDDISEMKFWGNYFVEDNLLHYREMFPQNEKLYEWFEQLLCSTECHSYGKEICRKNKSLKMPIDYTNFEDWVEEYNNRFRLTKVVLKKDLKKTVQRKLL